MADEMNNGGVAAAEGVSLRAIRPQFVANLYELQTVGARLEPLLEVAEQNDMRRRYIVYALAGFVSLLLLSSGAAPLLANMLGVVYPLYAKCRGHPRARQRRGEQVARLLVGVRRDQRG
ncbi:unnamed protein product [Sphagnum balticum]